MQFDRKKRKKLGVRVFLDEKNINGGASTFFTIRKNIQDCNEFLVLLSEYSIDQKWIQYEIGAAWGLEKYIVAIIDKVNPKEIPDIIRNDKAIELNDFDSYVEQLIKRVKKQVR